MAEERETSLPRVLIVLAGNTHPAVLRRHGDYDSWFRAGLEEGAARCELVSPFLGEALPAPASYGGVILTGSVSSVRDEAPWMLELGRWCLRAADEGVAVLGVCFGHQLLGEALGGRVEAGDRGREIGTVEVELTAAGREDPLFHGLPEKLLVQSTHGDEIAADPPGAVLRLAGNGFSRWQALAAGDRIRGVQFHIETNAGIMRDLLEAVGTPAPVQESDHGSRILQNWDRYFVRRQPRN